MTTGHTIISYKLDDDHTFTRRQRHDGTNWQNCY